MNLDQQWNAGLYAVGYIMLSALLLVSAHSIGMIDQGDFYRTVLRFLEYSIITEGDQANSQGVTWLIQKDPQSPKASGGTSSLLFWLAMYAQRVVSSAFSLLALGTVAKVGLLFIADRLGAQVTDAMAGGWWLRGVIAGLFALVIFSAHNIAFLNSLYMEYAYILFLPLLVLGALKPDSCSGRICLILGAAMCGAAKAQYFYLPVLLLGVLLVAARRMRWRYNWFLVIGLLSAQLLALVPLAHSDYTQVNYHHATELGSYLVMQPEQRRAFGLSPEHDACIGVDAWGNRLASANAVHFERGVKSCYGHTHLTPLDVIRPYLQYPTLLPRLWWVSSGVHFTVDYFHLDPKYRYIEPVDGISYHWGQWLVELSRLRDALIQPNLALATLTLALVLAWRRPFQSGVTFGPALTFLAIFALSQLIVSLVGEGIRDLSRHWAGAQYALDLLLVLLVVYGLAWWKGPAPQE